MRTVFQFCLAAVLVTLALCDVATRFGVWHKHRSSQPVDVTDDLFHRTSAGLFAPDREPLILRFEPNRSLRWNTPSGTLEFLLPRRDCIPGQDSVLEIRTYLDTEALASHHSICWAEGGCPTRVFRER